MTPDGSRRAANKVSAIWLAHFASGLISFIFLPRYLPLIDLL